MAFLITPTTELEAVNECLENIGQAPVSSISGDLGVDTEIALGYVRRINRQLQSQGWYWNTEKNFPMTPNGSGDIVLPSNTLSVRVTGTSLDMDLVQRGNRLYNRETHSYTFTAKVYVELTLAFTFEEIPETARRFIALRAARLFQDRIEGASDQGDSMDEAMAMADLKGDQLRVERPSVLSGSYGMMKTLSRTAF